MAPLFSEKEERVGDQPHSLRVENLSWILDIALLKTMEINKNSSLRTLCEVPSVKDKKTKTPHTDKRANLHPHTHTIENFTCEPTNLNDSLN